MIIDLNKINLAKIKSEVTRLTDAKEIKKEIKKLKTEILNFELSKHLNPQQKKKLKDLEKKYKGVKKNLHSAQRQFDREFNKGLRILEKTKKDFKNKIKNLEKISSFSISLPKKSKKKIKKKTQTLKKKKTNSQKKSITKKTSKKKTVKRTA